MADTRFSTYLDASIDNSTLYTLSQQYSNANLGIPEHKSILENMTFMDMYPPYMQVNPTLNDEEKILKDVDLEGNQVDEKGISIPQYSGNVSIIPGYSTSYVPKTLKEKDFIMENAPKILAHLSKLNEESHLGMSQDQMMNTAARILMQFAGESGWGKSNTAVSKNNLAGVMQKGVKITRKFNTLDDFYTYMFNNGIMYAGRYKDQLNADSNKAFVYGLYKHGYFGPGDLDSYLKSVGSSQTQQQWNWYVKQVKK